jgi:hypothetical protein
MRERIYRKRTRFANLQPPSIVKNRKRKRKRDAGGNSETGGQILLSGS